MKTITLLIATLLLLAATAFAHSDTTMTLDGGNLSGNNIWTVNDISSPGTLTFWLSPTQTALSHSFSQTVSGGLTFFPSDMNGNYGEIGGTLSDVVLSNGTLTAKFNGFDCLAASCSYRDHTEVGISGVFTEQINLQTGTLGKGQLTYTVVPEPATYLTTLLGLCILALACPLDKFLRVC